ncbi:MAG: type I restriction-modification enzyme R subunit C-terminal domain-containing protein [Candidatus Bipolaricaulota bacterium]
MEHANDRTERGTRSSRIDPALRAAGWVVVPFRSAEWRGQRGPFAVTEYPTSTGPADYALLLDDSVVGVVEAKKLGLGPQEVLRQSERYASGLGGGHVASAEPRVPFLYSTNGEIVRFLDTRHPLNCSRNIATFHTPSALRELLARDSDACLAALAASTRWSERLRPYQVEANQAVELALADRKRLMLLAMATGTGKTLTMVNQVYRLMEAGVSRRILFLVDRRALAAQAVRAFASYEAKPGLKFDQVYEVYSQKFQRDDFDEEDPFDPKVLPGSYLTDPKPGDAFVYVSTIQRMTINLFGKQAALRPSDEEVDDDAQQIKIPVHAFDLVIADECHRGYTTAELSVWKKTLDHFDAVKIGLTATPAAHTKAYFKDVVYRYEYDRAIREGYLVDYDAVGIRSDVRMNGVFLKPGEQLAVVDTRSGAETMDELEDERQFASEDIERAITSPDSNRKIIEELKKYADEHEQRYGRQPKCLVFAANDLPHISHADQLVEICRTVFGRGESFVQKITGRVDRPLKRIREFRNRPNPGIAVTVDMLSTGVDVPDLEFLVLLRPIRSRILFEQILGRGTRKGEKLTDKSHFTVFDCFDGTLLEYFRRATSMTAELPAKPARSLAEVVEDIWANRDRAYNTRCLVKRLQRIEKEMSGEARQQFAHYYIPEGDVGRFARGLPAALDGDFAATMNLLRNAGFQTLLADYPRPARTFYVAYGVEDSVGSQWLIRDGTGVQYRPEDYLTAFERFVRENQTEVEAIGVLLERPQGWGTTALTELRAKLAAAPEHFTPQNLERAFAARYGRALVDIISMVKHAAREQEPLLTAAERVDRALATITAGKQFTVQQEQWLARIREHLIANLTVESDDFDRLPVFAREGGWRRANREFAGKLDEVLRVVNTAVAA